MENDESRHGPRIPQTKDIWQLQEFASIGIGPGQDVEKMDASTRRGFERAAADGMKILRGAIATGLGKRVNGWTYPPPAMGRAGLHDHFLLRGSLQCLGGIIANEPEEAIYMNTFTDASGEPLPGANRYIMHFPVGELPKVKAFWSVTAPELVKQEWGAPPVTKSDSR